MSLPGSRFIRPDAVVKISRQCYSSIPEEINRFLAEIVVTGGNDSKAKKNALLAKRIPPSSLSPQRKLAKEVLGSSKLQSLSNVCVSLPNNNHDNYGKWNLNKTLSKMVFASGQTANYKPTKYTESLKVAKEVEMNVNTCPRLLHNELAHVFREVDVSEKPVTILTVTSIKLKNGNYYETDADFAAKLLDRTQLYPMFVEVASTVCKRLNKMGYWANFIDPVTGRPNEGRFAPISKVASKYKQIGFEIGKIGSCTVTRNVNWKEQFLGAIFTDAPCNCEALHQAIFNP
uniref:Uncharacterized protein n=1 Tax=Ditylenchus dipsaci TaxID=166011 RepID=A0A915DTH7_9BILA